MSEYRERFAWKTDSTEARVLESDTIGGNIRRCAVKRTSSSVTIDSNVAFTWPTGYNIQGGLFLSSWFAIDAHWRKARVMGQVIAAPIRASDDMGKKCKKMSIRQQGLGIGDG